jgi:hypothetical protein
VFNFLHVGGDFDLGPIPEAVELSYLLKDFRLDRKSFFATIGAGLQVGEISKLLVDTGDRAISQPMESVRVLESEATPQLGVWVH